MTVSDIRSDTLPRKDSLGAEQCAYGLLFHDKVSPLSFEFASLMLIVGRSVLVPRQRPQLT